MAQLIEGGSQRSPRTVLAATVYQPRHTLGHACPAYFLLTHLPLQRQRPVQAGSTSEDISLEKLPKLPRRPQAVNDVLGSEQQPEGSPAPVGHIRPTGSVSAVTGPADTAGFKTDN